MPSTADEIIVLLGHVNDESGQLTPEAVDRCDAALSLAATRPKALILPTGEFGDGFNRFWKPHGRLMTEYLLSRGFKASRILPFARSTRTLEDAFMARPLLLGAKARRITIVTSDYHADRVRFIFGHAIPDMDIAIHEVATPALLSDGRKESYKLDRQKAEWIDPPLMRMPEDPFPSEIYNSSSEDQKHYDRMSYLMIAGAFVSFAFPYVLGSGWPAGTRVAAFLISIVFILALFSLYVRSAVFANTARQVMYLIELQWRAGFSLNSRRQRLVQSMPMALDPAYCSAHMRPFARALNKFRVFTRLGFATTVMSLMTILSVIQMVAAAISFLIPSLEG